MKEMHDIEFFDHTADIGIRLQRSSKKELFRDAAFAMFHIIEPETKYRDLVNYEITVDGQDLEELMVNWLSDLNFYFQIEGYVPLNIRLTLAANGLTAQIQGYALNRSVHNSQVEIKAVTYHKIYVRQEDGAWKTQVIFDI
ncbi:archease [candidate division KSB1 bacterium]|nr:archease [candidate division KSB1 bacterium]